MTPAIGVSGASGLIGRAVVARLRATGARVCPLVRSPAVLREGDLRWDPATGSVSGPGAEHLEAVVHLAGESVGGARWTDARKRALRDSRIGPTRALCRELSRRKRRPEVLIAASALGYYGDRGEEVVDENSPPGRGFLAELCAEWEAATQPAREAGIRVVNLRIGVVLASGGGVLARLLRVFRLGLGGPVGGGRQYVSWIALPDVAGAIQHALERPELSGAVNAVAPQPVTNAELSRALAAALGRPAAVRLPQLAVRALLGQMGEELLLFGARIRPARLLESGYVFQFPELEGALREVVGRSRR
jgi:hypothetical protein